MPNVSIDREYWRKARADYSNWPAIIGREFLQNADDAGATEVRFVVVANEADRCTVEVTDNGCGMSRAVMEQKLLCLGGSGKDFREGAVGGFGVAKTVLLFSQISYYVKSLDHWFSGASGTYSTIRRCSGSGEDIKIKGTYFKVVMDCSAERIKSGIRAFVQRSKLGCRVWLNGVEVNACGLKWKFLKTTDTGHIYTADVEAGSVLYKKMIVRLNGHFMFEYSHEVPGMCAMVELLDSGRLQANRDGLRYPYAIELVEYIKILSTNKQRFFRLRASRTFLYRRADRVGDGCGCGCAESRVIGGGVAAALSGVESGTVVSVTNIGGVRAHEESVTLLDGGGCGVHSYAITTLFSGDVPQDLLLPLAPWAVLLLAKWRAAVVTLSKLGEIDRRCSVGFVLEEGVHGMSHYVSGHGECVSIAPYQITRRCVDLDGGGGMSGVEGSYEYTVAEWSDLDILLTCCHELAHLNDRGGSGHDASWDAEFTRLVKIVVAERDSLLELLQFVGECKLSNTLDGGEDVDRVGVSESVLD